MGHVVWLWSADDCGLCSSWFKYVFFLPQDFGSGKASSCSVGAMEKISSCASLEHGMNQLNSQLQPSTPKKTATCLDCLKSEIISVINSLCRTIAAIVLRSSLKGALMRNGRTLSPLKPVLCSKVLGTPPKACS